MHMDMGENIENSGIHDRFLSRSYSSKEEFLREYNKLYCQKSKASELNLVVSTKLKKSISEGNIDNFKKYYSFVDYICNIENSAAPSEIFGRMKITNLIIILACKYNQIDILKYIFSNILSISCKNDPITPHAQDESCHDAFYYALHSGNVKLVYSLINEWPDKYFTAHPEALEEILSSAFENLKLKNVLLPEEMKIFVKKKLIDLRFYSGAENVKNDFNNVRKRVELVIENIGFLKTYRNNEVNGIFLFVAKFLAQNLYILKNQLKFTYNKLPWEEIEFCLISFISSYTKCQQINLFYQTNLNKIKILNYLEIFSLKLKQEIIDTDLKNFYDNFVEFPKLKREVIVSEIINGCQEFEKLYSDFEKIRDITSLEKIDYYIKIALSANLEETEGRLILTRTLQIISEYLKNTLESPKLSTITSELILLSLSKNTRNIITELQNLKSYTSSRLQIQENIDFLIDFQNDIKNISNVIKNMIHSRKKKAVWTILKEMLKSENFEEMKEIAEIFKNVQLNETFSAIFKMTQPEKLKKLITELSENVPDPTNYEIERFNKIDKIICEKLKYENNFFDDVMFVAALSSLNIWFHNDKIDDSLFREIKIIVTELLEYYSKFETKDFKEIVKLSMRIFQSVISRVQDTNNLDKINKLIYEIFYIAQFEIDDDRIWIEELRKEFHVKISSQQNKFDDKIFFNKKISSEAEYNILASKLSELEAILKNYSSDGKLSLENKKLRTAVEILVLDILSILESSHNFLEDNLLSFDEDSPLLIGKCLFDHLAQDNEFLLDPSMEIILNANKLISENMLKNTKKIGKFVPDDFIKLKANYEERLDIVTNQEILFEALEKGNFEILKDSLKKGADMNARNFDLRTAFHFAAKGSNLEVIKFVKNNNNNLGVNSKDIHGQSPLHIAAKYGRKDIINFLLQIDTDLTDLADNFHEIPLHIAAKNGHKDAVEILLKNRYIESMSGYMAILCAITNHHTDVAKFLLYKQSNFDINELPGAFSPLYSASESGNSDLVNFLLENKANVNFKNGRKEMTALHVAATRGHLEIVKILIFNKADVNSSDSNDRTPLYYAAERGHKMIVENLLTNGALVDYANNIRQTPLHIATKCGHEKIVEILLKFKANPNFHNIDGITCLHFAAKNNNFHIALNLIKNGALIDDKDFKNSTALHYAAENGSEIVGEILIKNGAEIDAKNGENFTPLHIAALNGNKEFVEILIQNKADVRIRNIGKCTPLHLAALNGSTDILEILVKNKSEINIENVIGMTPLHTAVLNNHEKAVEFLIKNKAEVNKITSFGCTALHFAAEEGHENILNLLIKYKANINATSNLNYTPLHAAVEHGHKKIVKILIENGANINEGTSCLLRAISLGYLDIVKIFIEKNVNIFMDEKEEGGVNRLLLHAAAEKGHKDIVNYLIENGASVNTVSNNGRTALHLAAEQGHKEIVEILLFNNNLLHSVGCGDSPIQLAIKNGHDNVVEVLLKYGSKIDFKDRDGRTPLEIAANCGYLRILKMLLNHKKVDLNAKGMQGQTLLHIATVKNNLEMVKFLVNEEGADINSKNSGNLKSIHIAVEKGYEDIVEFFLDKGSNINDLGDKNQTLLHYASSRGQLEMIKFLISKNADVNAKDMNNETPLHLVRNEDTIKILLENGSFYNSVDKFGRKPSHKIFELIDKLFDAVKRNVSSGVKKSIKSGAFVNAKNSENYTPLHYAAWKGHEEIVKILLKNKADPNSVGHQNLTPLHYATEFSKLIIFKILLSNGAIYNPISDSGKTPLEFAVDRDIINLLKLINDCFGKIQENNPELITILNRIEDVAILRILMNACNQENKTLLVWAMHNNFSKIKELKEITEGGDLSAVINIALKFCAKGDYKFALNILNEASKRINCLLGPNNPANFEIQSNIAKVVYKQGNFQEALDLQEKIYKKQKKIFGENDKDTLNTKSSIALIFYRQGRNKEALKIFEEVLKKQEELLGSNHEDVLNTKFHSALALNDEGNYEKALRINKEILEKRTEILGKHHLATVSAKNNIGMVLNNQGKHEEALKIYKEVYEDKKIILGIDHFETIRVLHNMAIILNDQKKYSEAMKEFQKVLSMQKKILNENHPEILHTKYNIGSLLFSQSKFASAFKIFKDNIDKMIAVLGPNHPMVLDTSQRIRIINIQFKMAGQNPTTVLQTLQKDIYKFASEGDAESIEQLIKDGADVNCKDHEGRTALHYAIGNGHQNIVNILLKNQADLTLVTNKGNTTLHTACSKGYEKIVEILLQHISRDKLNQFLNAKTISGGTTALHVAAKINSLKIVKILFKNGAIYNIENAEGKMPIDLANAPNVIDLLKLIDDLFRYVANNNFKDISTKLDNVKSADVIKSITQARNSQGNTLLQVAVVNKCKKIAGKLVEMLKISVEKK